MSFGHRRVCDMVRQKSQNDRPLSEEYITLVRPTI